MLSVEWEYSRSIEAQAYGSGTYWINWNAGFLHWIIRNSFWVAVFVIISNQVKKLETKLKPKINRFFSPISGNYVLYETHQHEYVIAAITIIHDRDIVIQCTIENLKLQRNVSSSQIFSRKNTHEFPLRFANWFVYLPNECSTQ